MKAAFIILTLLVSSVTYAKEECTWEFKVVKLVPNETPYCNETDTRCHTGTAHLETYSGDPVVIYIDRLHTKIQLMSYVLNVAHEGGRHVSITYLTEPGTCGSSGRSILRDEEILSVVQVQR